MLKVSGKVYGACITLKKKLNNGTVHYELTFTNG